MLRDDHKRVGALFRAFGRDRDELSAEQKSALVTRICLELSVQTKLEREVLYPAARIAFGITGQELLDKAEVQHAIALDLVRQLKDASPATPYYDAKVRVLGEHVRRHIGEEHDEMFPRCRKAGIDLHALGQSMAERRAEFEGTN